MSDLRTAAQMALVALECIKLMQTDRHASDKLKLEEIVRIATEQADALRAALAAEPNPVACDDESDCTHMPWCRIRKQCQRAAPTAQPLTDEQIHQEFHERMNADAEDMALDVLDFKAGVRFAERAHGIGGTHG